MFLVVQVIAVGLEVIYTYYFTYEILSLIPSLLLLECFFVSFTFPFGNKAWDPSQFFSWLARSPLHQSFGLMYPQILQVGPSRFFLS